MVTTDELLLELNTLGCSLIRKQDVYHYLMGDTTALNKYKGDIKEGELEWTTNN